MFGRDTIAAFLEWVQGAGLWGALLFGLAYIPAAVLLVPASVMTLGAGFVFGIAKGTAIVSLGSTAGQALLAHELTHVAQQVRGAGGGLHRKSLYDMPFTHEDENAAEEAEIQEYQNATGATLTADQEHSMKSGKAKEQSDNHITDATEKIHDRVVDMMGEAARNQMMRNGSSRRA